jgi:hypothetical protein
MIALIMEVVFREPVKSVKLAILVKIVAFTSLILIYDT